MQANQTPTLIPLAFAANGTKNVIPEPSQITITPGAASLNDGFPPICAIPIAAGGISPDYGDFNGVFNLISAAVRWANGGGQYAWNSAFTTDANVAGYPNGAQLMRADLTGHWLNTADNNETNPDAVDGTSANWVPGYNYGIYAVTGLTNANVTLFPLQAAKNKITLAGALTGNIQIIFPAWLKEWEVINNTTGAFTVTAKTAGGTGVALAAGQQKITGDGTNITQPAESIALATLLTHGVQLGQTLGKFQPFTSSGTFTAPLTGTYYFTGVAAGAGGGSGQGNSGGQSLGVGGGGGGGGGAGQPIRMFAVALTAGQTVTITIGAAGGPAAAGGNTIIAVSGGATTTLTGGSPGSIGNAVGSNSIGGGGAGGAGGAGFPAGGPGADGNLMGNGGWGASTMFGDGGPPGRAATTAGAVGSAGNGAGSGGGGGGAGYGTTSATGAAGAAGVAGRMEVTW